MKRILLTLIIPFVAFTINAQTTVFVGATLHLGNGHAVKNGILKIKDGKIIAIDSGDYKSNSGDERLSIVDGKHIYPGFICLNTFMGLNGIDAVRATRDYAETGQMNPNARTLIAYNTDSKVLPTALFNGIIFAQIVPAGGTISGMSSVVRTKAWNWEDAQLTADDGVHLNWPEIGPWGYISKQQERNQKEIQAIEEFFAGAQQYLSIAKVDSKNLRFESMRGILDGSKKLFIHVNGEEAIVKAIQFVSSYPKVKPVLVGAEGAYMVKEYIKAKQIPVVLNLTHRLPKYAHEDVDLPYKLPAMLMNEGIVVAIANGGSWESRNVMFHAGTAATYGLSKEQALMCITKNAAIVTGSDKKIGTLEVGKDASFFVSTGDALDMKSNSIQQLYIDGNSVEVGGEQLELFNKYNHKYGFDKK